jgi:hypothetical protein
MPARKLKTAHTAIQDYYAALAAMTHLPGPRQTFLTKN